ncbi:hypothetical protein CsatA_008639 [Cannabis sativa]
MRFVKDLLTLNSDMILKATMTNVSPYGVENTCAKLRYTQWVLILGEILHIFKMDVSEAGACSWTEYVQANQVKCFYNEAPFWKNGGILMQLWNEVNKLESFNIHTRNIRDIVCDRNGDEIELFYWKSFM